MINLTVLYPYHGSKTFNKDHYLGEHVRIMKTHLSPYLKGLHVEVGLAGLAPNSPPSFYAIAQLTFNSVEDMAAAMQSESAKLVLNDVINYTDIEPVFQISEIKEV